MDDEHEVQVVRRAYNLHNTDSRPARMQFCYNIFGVCILSAHKVYSARAENIFVFAQAARERREESRPLIGRFFRGSPSLFPPNGKAKAAACRLNRLRAARRRIKFNFARAKKKGAGTSRGLGNFQRGLWFSQQKGGENRKKIRKRGKSLNFSLLQRVSERKFSTI